MLLLTKLKDARAVVVEVSRGHRAVARARPDGLIVGLGNEVGLAVEDVTKSLRALFRGLPGTGRVSGHGRVLEEYEGQDEEKGGEKHVWLEGLGGVWQEAVRWREGGRISSDRGRVFIPFAEVGHDPHRWHSPSASRRSP